MTTYEVDQLATALAAGARAFLAALDGGEEVPFPPPTPPTTTVNRAWIDFDPLHDDVPFAPNPRAERHSAANKLASFVYLGAVARFEAEEGRGANGAEISEFARKAGYPNGRAVNGWNSRPDSERAIDNNDGLRTVNDQARRWIRDFADELHINIVGSIERPDSNVG